METGASTHRCDISPNTDSGAILEWAKEQITSCKSGNDGHDQCQNYFVPSDERQFLPRRLLHVGQTDGSEIRLLETGEISISGPLHYLALSHSWGNANVAPTMLVQSPVESLSQRPSHYFDFSHGSESATLTGRMEEFEDWRKPITLGKLSKTIQDSISIVRGMGFQFLWVDSLCIIQNCKADIKEEIEKMGLIYANAICTVSATASANPASGCFFTTDRFLSDCGLREEENTSLLATFTGQEETPVARLFSEKVEQAPLTTRGWTFQERVLASRVLHFCNGTVLFECNKLQASFCHGHGAAYPRKRHVQIDGKPLRTLGRPLPNPPPTPPRPSISHIPSFPRPPSLPSLPTFSLPSFQLPTARYILKQRSRIVMVAPRRPYLPSSRPRRRRDYYIEYEENPHYLPLHHEFNLSFKWPRIPRLPGFYSLLNFYNFHDSYKGFREHASWTPQEVEVIDLTDTSARIGLRGAFEMLVNFKGTTEKEMMNFHESWYQLVERYSIRNFKREDEDKLLAIEGIAYFIGIKANFTFMAGLWKEAFPFNLLWVVHEDAPKPRPIRPFPTWSWASVNGMISHRPKKAIPRHAEIGLSTTPLINRNTSRQPKEPPTKVSETQWEKIKVLVSAVHVEPVKASLVLELNGHLVECDRRNVMFYPDIEDSLETTAVGLFCLPILLLERAHRSGLRKRYQLRGIVLQLDRSGSGMFQRIGYFWTKKRIVEREALGSLKRRIQII